MNQKILDRFWDKVEFTTNCWNWIACKSKKGYGQFSLNSRDTPAHRFSYELYKGKIQNGLQIDHLCRNRGCVNPRHLESVTLQENIKRGETGIKSGMLQKSKTHCPKGHEYNHSNTYVYKNERQCRVCKREYMRRRDI
jgi:hypothetical protein